MGGADDRNDLHHFHSHLPNPLIGYLDRDRQFLPTAHTRGQSGPTTTQNLITSPTLPGTDSGCVTQAERSCLDPAVLHILVSLVLFPSMNTHILRRRVEVMEVITIICTTHQSSTELDQRVVILRTNTASLMEKVNHKDGTPFILSLIHI